MEGNFARDFEMAVLAVQEDLRPEARRAREMEAEGYDERPLVFKWRQKACYTAANVLEVDPGHGAGAEAQDRTRAAGLGGAGQGRVGVVPGRGVGDVLGGGADTGGGGDPAEFGGACVVSYW